MTETPTVALDNGTTVPCVFLGTLQVHVADWPIAGDANNRYAPHLHVQDLQGGAGEIVPVTSPRAQLLAMQSEEIAQLVEDAKNQQPEAVAASSTPQAAGASQADIAALRDQVAQLTALMQAQAQAAPPAAPPASEPTPPPAPSEGETDGGHGTDVSA